MVCFCPPQFVWGSKRWLAYGYDFFIGDKEKAEAAYEACFDYDPARVDCLAFLSRLYLASECAAWLASCCALIPQKARPSIDLCRVPWRCCSETILTVRLRPTTTTLQGMP